jgi:hypothetical protein
MSEGSDPVFLCASRGVQGERSVAVARSAAGSVRSVPRRFTERARVLARQGWYDSSQRSCSALTRSVRCANGPRQGVRYFIPDPEMVHDQEGDVKRRQRRGRCMRCRLVGEVHAWYEEVDPLGDREQQVDAWLCVECLDLARAFRAAGGRLARLRARHR